jgi:hypothetical protein
MSTSWKGGNVGILWGSTSGHEGDAEHIMHMSEG